MPKKEKTYPESHYHKPNPVPVRQPEPPGIVLTKLLESKGIDLKEFTSRVARNARYPYLSTKLLFEGHPGYEMIAPIAYQLEVELGISGGFWMALQDDRDMWPLRRAAFEKQLKQSERNENKKNSR